MTGPTIESAPDTAVEGPPRFTTADAERRADPIPFRWAIAAWLAVMGAGAVVLGGHDTFAGGDVPARLVGTIVLAAGIVCLIAAAALVSRWREDRLLASMASAWAVLLGALVLLNQVTNGEPSGTLAIWIAVIVLSTGAFLVLRRSASATERQRFLKTLPAVGSVVSIGFLVSLAQFYYTTIYLPASSPPSLNVTIKLEPAGRRGDELALRGEVTVTNNSGTRATVLTSDVSVLGFKGTVPPRDFFVGGLRDVPQSTGQTLAARRYWAPTQVPTLLHLDRLFKDRETFLDPQYSRSEPITMWVRARRYDYVLVRADIFIVRGTVALDWAGTTQRVRRAPGRATLVDVSATTPIKERSWLRGLLRDDRSITTRWRLTNAGGGDVSVRFAPDDQRLSDNYGYAKTSASFELPLWKDG